MIYCEGNTWPEDYYCLIFLFVYLIYRSLSANHKLLIYHLRKDMEERAQKEQAGVGIERTTLMEEEIQV